MNRHIRARALLAAAFLFAAAETFAITSTGAWLAALAAIANGGDNKAYTLAVSGDVAVPGLDSFIFEGVSGLDITLAGNGRLRLAIPGPLFAIGPGQTLTIGVSGDAANGPVLEGMAGNKSPVIACGGGAIFMRSGAVIGNGNPDGFGGGGVYVEDGSFTMSGGSVSGNAAGDNGGGVCVMAAGGFAKTGGVIYGGAGGPLNNAAGGNGQGHAAFCVTYWDAYYRDTALREGDSISTAALPASGAGANWIKRGK
jgi:hypothetical protein